MSRKKDRGNVNITAKPHPMPATAIAVSRSEAVTSGIRTSAPSPGAGRTVAQERFWLAAVVAFISRWLGSLQLAVILLCLFAVVLISGTVMESWYDGKVAQQLVYRTWWFTGLLAFLGSNIFFAAAKKCDFSGWRQPARGNEVGFGGKASQLWPWKKHQTGFLITHVGLLTMLTGGILNSLHGTDALMAMVDDGKPGYRQYGEQTTNTVIDQDVSKIRVQHVRNPHQLGRSTGFAEEGSAEQGTMPAPEPVVQFDFRPGPLPWRADEYFTPQVDWLPALLNAVTHPFPQHWEQDLGGGARLEVVGYYPHVRKEVFGPARHGETDTFPAIKIQLASPMAGIMPDDWVAYHGTDRDLRQGPAWVQLLARHCPKKLVEEFLRPPPVNKVGTMGQLVLVLDGEKYRFDVARALGSRKPLGRSGWSVKITDYTADFTNKEEGALPENPAVKFALERDGASTGFAVVARYAGELFPIPGTDGEARPAVPDLHVWYHPPDYRWSDDRTRAMLQFVIGKDGKIYYRSFNSHLGTFQFEKSGTVAKGEKRQPIWAGMNWKFRVTDFVPHAVGPPYFIPENRRPGLEDEETPPGIRCRLTAGKDSREFWLLKKENSLTPIRVGNEIFRVGYNTYVRHLPFEITLQRAEQTSDPGTGAAATYTSFVLLNDKTESIVDEPQVITMNHPMNHRGYKFYQTSYLSLPADPDSKKPASRSVFTVSDDPGLLLKYAGSAMLALGIVCMFYMKAYFFKPRSRSRPKTHTLSNGALAQGL